MYSVSESSAYHVHKTAGVIKFDRPVFRHHITVDYDGGFDPTNLPADLVLALMQIAATHFGTLTSGGATATAGGAIKSISSAGSRVEYDTSGGAVAGTDAETGFPSSSINVLDMYRREIC